MSSLLKGIRFSTLLLLVLLLHPQSIQAQDQELTYKEVLLLGRGNARQLAWSPDGRFLAVSSDAGVWIYTDELEDVVWLEDTAYASSMLWSPDGSRLAVAAAAWGEGEVLIFNATGWSVANILPNAFASHLAWKADGSQIALASSETTITIWDVTSSNLILTVENERPIRAIAWSADETRLLVAGIERGSFDFEIAIWDATSGTKLARYVSDTGTGDIREGSLTSTESLEQQELGPFLGFIFEHFLLWNILVITSILLLVISIIFVVRTHRIHRLGKGVAVAVLVIGITGIAVVEVGSCLALSVFAVANFPSQGDMSTVTAAFNRDGTQLAVGGWYGRVTIWDLNERKRIKHIGDSSDALGNLGTVASLAWSSEGDSLAVACFEGTLLWNQNTGSIQRLPSDTEIQNLYGGIYVAWSGDDTRIAAIYWEIERGPYRILTWDASTQQLLGDLPEHKRSLSFAAWSPQGDRIATWGADSLFIWDIASGELLQTLETTSAAHASWNPNGTNISLLSYNMGSQIEEWDVQSGQQLNVSRLEPAAYLRVAMWSPDTKYLAGADEKFNVLIWDSNGQLIHTMTGHSDLVLALAWNNDSKSLASASEDGTVRLWDIVTGTLITEFKGHNHIVNNVAWSPDGHRIVSTDNGDRLLMWNVASQQIIYEVQTKSGALAWSPNGKLLSVGGCTYLICSPGINIWNADTGGELLHLDRIIGDTYWSPDGNTLALSGLGVVRIIHLEEAP